MYEEPVGRPRRAEPGCGLREARDKRQGGWAGMEDGVKYDPNLNPLKTDRQTDKIRGRDDTPKKRKQK